MEKEGERNLGIDRGQDISFEDLQRHFPAMDMRRTASRIGLFLKSVAENTSNRVLAFSSEVEFDGDGLVGPGRHNDPHVLSLFGISLRSISDIKYLFENLKGAEHFALKYEEVGQNPLKVRLTIGKQKETPVENVRDASEADAILGEAFAKKRAERLKGWITDIR